MIQNHGRNRAFQRYEKLLYSSEMFVELQIKLCLPSWGEPYLYPNSNDKHKFAHHLSKNSYFYKQKCEIRLNIVHFIRIPYILSCYVNKYAFQWCKDQHFKAFLKCGGYFRTTSYESAEF